jgi:hypothetical protein
LPNFLWKTICIAFEQNIAQKKTLIHTSSENTKIQGNSPQFAMLGLVLRWKAPKPNRVPSLNTLKNSNTKHPRAMYHQLNKTLMVKTW